MNLHTYQQFVQQKAAPSYNLSSKDFNLLHGALGIATELLELQQSTTAENTEEELGDLLWYLTYTASLIITDTKLLEDIYYDAKFDSHGNSLPQKDLLVEAEVFLSLVKKRVIYQQLVETLPTFLRLWATFSIYCKACDSSLANLIASNVKKLEKRYAASFTKEESETRKDKS